MKEIKSILNLKCYNCLKMFPKYIIYSPDMQFTQDQDNKNRQ